jgi:FlaA1/EpsC-like NDP-sugar epimerase
MTINDDQNPEGDIKISFTGLRPGEKLYEELLIDEKSVATKHDKIMRAEEKGIEWDELEVCISKLEQAVIESDFNKIREIFLNTVSGYNPEKKINEYLQ